MLIITAVQKCSLAITPVDAAGNPAPVDGVPVWSASDTGLLDVVPAANGMSATVIAKGPLGTAQVNVTADADLGTGVENIAGLLDVQVVAGKAAALAITAGTPEPK